MEYRAALLASHGFASMAIDYLTAKITMETGKMVDNQYFEVHLTKLMFWLQGNNVKKKRRWVQLVSFTSIAMLTTLGFHLSFPSF